MRSPHRTWHRILCMVLFFQLCLGLFPQGADAATRTKVMTITATSGSSTAKATVYAIPYSSWGYDFELDNDELDLMLKKQTSAIKVSVKVLKPKIIIAGSVKYNKTVKMNDRFSVYQSLSFQYRDREDGSAWSNSLSYQINTHTLSLSVDNLYLAVNSKGFHPGSGAYMPIEANLSMNARNLDGSSQLRLRILNSKGKYVFQKVFQINSDSGYVRYRWDGKASKKNEAGIKAGTYVPNGTYKVEAVYSYKKESYEKFAKNLPTAKATKSFKVSSKTPSGTEGMAKAKEIPIYTGNATIDYLAECMIKEAGITSSTSADQKVKKIYHYMTTHFKHIHYWEVTNRKVYYNTEKLGSKIRKFEKTSRNSYKNKKVLYSYKVTSFLEENMKTRSGVCDDHAAIFELLCKHVGVDAGVCTGYYLNSSGTRAPHAWNYAVINGVTWYYDVDVEIQNYGKGQGDYYWYKKTRTQANQIHDFQVIYK